MHLTTWVNHEPVADFDLEDDTDLERLVDYLSWKMQGRYWELTETGESLLAEEMES